MQDIARGAEATRRACRDPATSTIAMDVSWMWETESGAWVEFEAMACVEIELQYRCGLFSFILNPSIIVDLDDDAADIDGISHRIMRRSLWHCEDAGQTYSFDDSICIGLETRRQTDEADFQIDGVRFAREDHRVLLVCESGDRRAVKRPAATPGLSACVLGGFAQEGIRGEMVGWWVYHRGEGEHLEWAVAQLWELHGRTELLREAAELGIPEACYHWASVFVQQHGMKHPRSSISFVGPRWEVLQELPRPWHA
jgi:hypothetical protein